MKNLKIAVLCLIVFTTSCKKETDSPSKKSPKNLSEFIASLQEFETPDYFVLVSSMYNNSPMDTGFFNSDYVGLTIQAGEIGNNYVGNLMVGDTEIPFYEEGYYHNQVVTNQMGFFGNTLSFNLTGDGFPSFSLSECSPTPTRMSFDGLDDYRINLAGVDVNWTPDVLCDGEGLYSYILLYADDNSSNSHFVSIPVSDGDGSLSIDNSVLSQFSAFETLSILYMRGYQNIHTVSGKKIDLRFVQLSNTKFGILN